MLVEIGMVVEIGIVGKKETEIAVEKGMKTVGKEETVMAVEKGTKTVGKKKTEIAVENGMVVAFAALMQRRNDLFLFPNFVYSYYNITEKIYIKTLFLLNYSKQV